MRSFILVFLIAAVSTNAQDSICNRSYRSREWRVLSWGGVERGLVLHCGSAPSCAAAALLRVMLVHTFAYRNVKLLIGPHRLTNFIKSYDRKVSENYPNALVDLSSAWQPVSEVTSEWKKARLETFGASNITARRLLLAHLSSVATETNCAEYRYYHFYANSSLLRHCGFLSINSTEDKAPVYVVIDKLLNEVPDNAVVLKRLVNQLNERVKAAKLLLNVRSATRLELGQWLRDNRSLLFIDFDIWPDKDIVSVQPPPCVSRSICNYDLDTVVPMRVADVKLLQTWGRGLFDLINNFFPSKHHLKEVLELSSEFEQSSSQLVNGSIEASSIYEEAACKWVDSNIDEFNALGTNVTSNLYRVVVFFCNDDYNIYDVKSNPYFNLLNATQSYINETFDFEVLIHMETANCSDANEMRLKLTENYLKRTHQYRLLGVLVPRGAGVSSLAQVATDYKIITIAYDGVPASEAPAVWLLTPTNLHAHAIAQFVRAYRWTRIAVLSEDTALAKDFVKALNQEEGFVVGDFTLPRNLLKSNVKKKLNSLSNDNGARIFFINADSETAFKVLTAAHDMSRDDKDKYIWIVRDKLPRFMNINLTYYTISPYARRMTDLVKWPNEEGDPKLRQFLNSSVTTTWPDRHTNAIVDGLWMLVTGFDKLWLQKPSSKNDLRNSHTIRFLKKILKNEPINGVTESLRFEGHALAARSMFVERRHGRQLDFLDKWRSDTKPTKNLIEDPPSDGATHCVLKHGDRFSPSCSDSAWAAGLVALIIAPMVILSILRQTLLILKRREEAIRRQCMLTRAQCSVELINWRVFRSDIIIIGFLGAGHFASVSKAVLRVKGGAALYVAAKELHQGASPAEESELLREACTLASLSHPHVVRLVGVCDDGGPPLVLTEVALFGDLHGYLSARRHLVEGGAVVPEAEHVSAAALTRLAREAAAALQHLAARGVVHRDVRAANCLVDAGRALKLADFGMARRTGAAEYVCMRRAVVPVRWMAPEAVTRGAFSAASDVWALGVLLLELMTLGARPWGAAPPERVLCRVAAGERPPLPRDASPPARALMALCWAEATDRPPAEEVRAYLARNPEVLSPALATRDIDADSGFGEATYLSSSSFSGDYTQI